LYVCFFFLLRPLTGIAEQIWSRQDTRGEVRLIGRGPPRCVAFYARYFPTRCPRKGEWSKTDPLHFTRPRLRPPSMKISNLEHGGRAEAAI
jgi:hypothetical protein